MKFWSQTIEDIFNWMEYHDLELNEESMIQYLSNFGPPMRRPCYLRRIVANMRKANMPEDLVNRIGRIRTHDLVGRTPYDPMTDEEVLVLIRKLNAIREPWRRAMTKAYAALLFCSGMKPSLIDRLERKHIVLGYNSLPVALERPGTTTLPLPRWVGKAFVNYMAFTPTMQGPLFQTPEGEQVSTYNIAVSIRRLYPGFSWLRMRATFIRLAMASGLHPFDIHDACVHHSVYTLLQAMPWQKRPVIRATEGLSLLSK